MQKLAVPNLKPSLNNSLTPNSKSLERTFSLSEIKARRKVVELNVRLLSSRVNVLQQERHKLDRTINDTKVKAHDIFKRRLEKEQNQAMLQELASMTQAANQVSTKSNQNLRLQKQQELQQLRDLLREQRHAQFIQIKRQQEINEKRVREAKKAFQNQQYEKRNRVQRMEKAAEERIRQFHDLRQEEFAMEKWKSYEEEEQRIQEMEQEINKLGHTEDNFLDIIKDKQTVAIKVLETLEDANTLPVEELAPRFQSVRPQKYHTNNAMPTYNMSIISTPPNRKKYPIAPQDSNRLFKNSFRSPQGRLQGIKTDVSAQISMSDMTPDSKPTKYVDSTKFPITFKMKSPQDEEGSTQVRFKKPERPNNDEDVDENTHPQQKEEENTEMLKLNQDA